MKGLISKSTKLLSLLVGQIGTATMGLNLRSAGLRTLIYGLFWALDTSVIYVDWFSQDKPMIPKKFRSRTFTNEPEEQKKIKERLSVEKMKAQASLFHLTAERNKVKYEEKDREMLNEIEKIPSIHVRQQFQELWKNDCKKKEDKSLNLWEEKKTWLLKQENNTEDTGTNNAEDEIPNSANNRNPRRQRRVNREANNLKEITTGAKTISAETSPTPKIVIKETHNNVSRRANSRAVNREQQIMK